MLPRDFAFWAELFKAGLRYPRVSSKFEFRYESLKSKFSLIIFVNNLRLATLKRIEKIVREMLLMKRKREAS